MEAIVSGTPHWAVMATIRHENAAVLRAVDAGLTDPDAIAVRANMGAFRTRLAIRRLVAAGLLVVE